MLAYDYQYIFMGDKMRFIRKFFCRFLFILFVGIGSFSYSGDFLFFRSGHHFISSVQADSYSGLSSEEKNYLRQQGYSDAQISNFEQEAGKFGETRRDTSSQNDYKFSSEAKKMTAALAKQFGPKSLSYVKYANSSPALQQGSVGLAAIKGAASGFVEGLTGKTGMNNYELIFTAFTSIQNGCWFCPVFSTLFTTINSLAARTNSGLASTIAGGPGSLLWLLFYGYILFVIGKMFLTSAFKEISGMDLLSKIFIPLLTCVIATILINNWKAIYTYLLDPLLIGAIGLGQEIQGNTAANFSASAGLTGITIDTTCDLSSFGNTMATTAPRLNSLSFEGGGAVSANFIEISSSGMALADGVGEAIQCFLKTSSQILIAWMTIGATFMADCWKEKVFFIFPNFQMLIIGLLIFIGAFLIFLSFPLKLLDAMFRLMFVTALMPLWIAFYVLPQTRSYTQKAFGMLVHIMVTFVILSVVLVMVCEIIKSIFTPAVSGIDIKQLADLLQSDKAAKAMEKINFSSVGIFLSFALMYLAFSLVGKAETFIGQFASGGGSLGIGQDATSRVTGAAGKAGNVGVHAVGAAGRLGAKGAKKAGSKVASSYRAYKAEKRAETPTPEPTPRPEGGG